MCYLSIYVSMVSVTLRNAIITLVMYLCINYHVRAQHGTLYIVRMQLPPPPLSDLDLPRNHVHRWMPQEVATAWAPWCYATVHHCFVDLLPTKVFRWIPGWCMGKVASVQWCSHTLGAQRCYRGALGVITAHWLLLWKPEVELTACMWRELIGER